MFHSCTPTPLHLQVAAAAGVPVLLDAGGVDAPISVELLAHLSIISPNETELARLTAGQPADTEQQVLAAASALQQQAAAAVGALTPQQQVQQQHGRQQLQVLVKRGAEGSLLVAPDGELAGRQAAIPASKLVDTTGKTLGPSVRVHNIIFAANSLLPLCITRALFVQKGQWSAGL